LRSSAGGRTHHEHQQANERQAEIYTIHNTYIMVKAGRFKHEYGTITVIT